ncbi:hypothetical protein JR316_0005899 [Psilocybe cubensis]|uniref:Uncharacterized protein n=1 Tax=Psilocybe cubensis TaxID=181762 RepID=A0ACB8H0K1_PSICU|nr:hypothetical protein JR316_0005899 [Psilocybe cubensis]KAH9481374.1 hypothetical protein JR316_0005899 [Psilocybe cubensis]
MKSAFAAVATALCLSAGALAQTSPPLVNTPVPNPPVCQPLLITWSGGTPPYFLRSVGFPSLVVPLLNILPGGQPSAPALLDFGQVDGTSLTWRVNFTVGTSLGLVLRDNTGLVSQSAPFSVAAGSDLSCLSGSGSSSTGSSSTGSGPGSSSSSGSSSTAAVTSPTSPASTPVTPTSRSSSASSHSSGTGTSSSATNAPSSAASIESVQMGLVGALGAALVALLA